MKLRDPMVQLIILEEQLLLYWSYMLDTKYIQFVEMYILLVLV